MIIRLVGFGRQSQYGGSEAAVGLRGDHPPCADTFSDFGIGESGAQRLSDLPDRILGARPPVRGCQFRGTARQQPNRLLTSGGERSKFFGIRASLRATQAVTQIEQFRNVLGLCAHE